MRPLKTARLASGLTALKLAELAGSNEMRIYSIERGRFKPRVDEALRIAEVLHCTPAELFPDMFDDGADNAANEGGNQ